MPDLKPDCYYNVFLKKICGKVPDTAVIRGMYDNRKPKSHRRRNSMFPAPFFAKNRICFTETVLL